MIEWQPPKRPAQNPVQFLRSLGHVVEPTGLGLARVDAGPELTQGQLVDVARRAGWQPQS